MTLLPCERVFSMSWKEYAFQFRDGFQGGDVAEVPFCCWPMTEEWMRHAAHSCTWGRHFWKWN